MIETTGLANPAPVIQTFFVDEDIKEACLLDAVLTVVDAKHIMQHLDEEKPDGVVNEAGITGMRAMGHSGSVAALQRVPCTLCMGPAMRHVVMWHSHAWSQPCNMCYFTFACMEDPCNMWHLHAWRSHDACGICMHGGAMRHVALGCS